MQSCNTFGRFSFVPAKNIWNGNFSTKKGFCSFGILYTSDLSEADDKLSFNLLVIMNLSVSLND